MRKRHEDSGGILSPLMACYHAVHDYPGGLPVVAMLMNKNADTLSKKLNPSLHTHLLTLEESMHILRITNDQRILDAIGAEAKVIWVRPEEVANFPGDLDVLHTGTTLMDRTVGILTELETALEDGQIDRDERARLDKCFLRLNQAAWQVSETARQFEAKE